jgi:hypothetical protein
MTSLGRERAFMAQARAAQKAPHRRKQMADVIALLRKTRDDADFDYLKQRLGLDLYGEANELLAELTKSTKLNVAWDANETDEYRRYQSYRISYRPVHAGVSNIDELLRLLEQHTGGIPAADLADAYEHCLRDIDRLTQRGDAPVFKVAIDEVATGRKKLSDKDYGRTDAQIAADRARKTTARDVAKAAAAAEAARLAFVVYPVDRTNRVTMAPELRELWREVEPPKLAIHLEEQIAASSSQGGGKGAVGKAEQRAQLQQSLRARQLTLTTAAAAAKARSKLGKKRKRNGTISGHDYLRNDPTYAFMFADDSAKAAPAVRKKDKKR